MATTVQIGVAVGRRRELLGLTKLPLSQEARSGWNVLGNIQSGRVTARISTLDRLAEALGCTLAELMRGDTAGPPDAIVATSAHDIAAPALAGSGLTESAADFAPAARPMPLRDRLASRRLAPSDLADLLALPDLAPLPEAL